MGLKRVSNESFSKQSKRLCLNKNLVDTWQLRETETESVDYALFKYESPDIGDVAYGIIAHE